MSFPFYVWVPIYFSCLVGNLTRFSISTMTEFSFFRWTYPLTNVLFYSSLPISHDSEPVCTIHQKRKQLNQFSHCSFYYWHLRSSDSNVRKTDEKTVSTSLRSPFDVLNSPSERTQLTARLLWTHLMQRTVSSSDCTALHCVISLMSSLINKPVTLSSLCLLLESGTCGGSF